MKVEEHMRHEHNGRRNVTTEFGATPPIEVRQPSDVAAQTLPASLEEILDAPAESAFPLSNAPVPSARTPPAPFPMPSDTIANSPPSNYGHSVNGTHDTISHHSAIPTASSSLPKSTNAMSKKTNVFVLMPPRPRYVQRAQEIGKENELVRGILSPAGLRAVPTGINNHQAVICITCQKAVSFDMVIRHNHAMQEHGVALTKQQKKALVNWFTNSKGGFILRAKDVSSCPAPDETPISGVEIKKGLKCEASGCTYCCVSKDTMQGHWKDSHKGLHRREHGWESDLESDFWTPASVQRLLSSSYFVVNPALANTPSGDVYRIYLRQYAPQLQECKTLFLQPTSEFEIPPLLRITGWHEHLADYTKSARSVARIRSLMLPPRKEEFRSWRGQTLMDTIQTYMRVIQQKAKSHQSGLRIRKMLVEQPK